MHTLLSVLLIVVSIFMIVLVLMQSSNSSGLSGAISGGAEQLFGKQKARGIEAVLNRITVVVAVLFFALTIGVTYLSI
ncbi:preprotein translocase subunit SecG [Bacillus sp. C1]